MENLKILRQHLDQIDSQIVFLLNKRMETADEIAKWKIEHRDPIVDKPREEEVLDKAGKLVNHPVLKDYIVEIFNLIMNCAKISRSLQEHESVPFQRIGLIGLGLMGGSIAKALKLKNKNIELFTLKSDVYNSLDAIESGLLNKEYSTLTDFLENSELIILCTPISTIIPLAKQIASVSVSHKLLIMDIASVKSEITKTFEDLTNVNLEYFSTHPMTGSENSGFKNSLATLFVNAPWIVVPHGKNSQEGLFQIKAFFEFIGAKPIVLDAKTHDIQTALISHIPGQISNDILNFVKQKDPSSLKIAGPGFKSMTRLAHSNPLLRSEIASFNKMNIEKYLKEWLDYVKKGEKT